MAVTTSVRRLRTELGRWLRLGWPWLRRLLLMLALTVVVLWPLPALLTRHPSHGLTAAERLKATNDVRGTLVQALAGLALLGGLFFTSRTFRLTREGQLTDRYTKAVEQLGNEKLDVRLGGIYALERLVVDSARDHPTILEVLTAFLREHAKSPADAAPPESGPLPMPADTAAVARVIARRPRGREERGPVDVHSCYLVRAYLPGANLSGANLFGANLFEANLFGANLSDADLSRANLLEAQGLTSQQLQSAGNLDGARLPTYLTEDST